MAKEGQAWALVVCVCAALLLARCHALRPPASLEAARPDTTVALGTPLARFEGARGLGVAPDGTVYVADAARDVVVRLFSPREGEGVLGGPGSAAGQFDAPSDVDPTNGLVLVVADPGNGRVQRFSRAFRHLETLPVGRGYAAAGATPARPVFDVGDAGPQDLGGGRPVAVAEPQGDATYALDAAEGHVLRWEDQRRAVRVIGGFSDGDGALRDPVDLAVGPAGTLYVADAGAVMTYDRFGSFLGERAVGLDARALATGPDGRLYLVQAEAVFVFDREGRLLRRVRFPSPAEAAGVVDVAPHAGGLYVLTAEALYRVGMR